MADEDIPPLPLGTTPLQGADIPPLPPGTTPAEDFPPLPPGVTPNLPISEETTLGQIADVMSHSRLGRAYEGAELLARPVTKPVGSAIQLSDTGIGGLIRLSRELWRGKTGEDAIRAASQSIQENRGIGHESLDPFFEPGIGRSIGETAIDILGSPANIVVGSALGKLMALGEAPGIAKGAGLPDEALTGLAATGDAAVGRAAPAAVAKADPKLQALYQRQLKLNRDWSDQDQAFRSFLSRTKGLDSPGINTEFEEKMAGLRKTEEDLSALDAEIRKHGAELEVRPPSQPAPPDELLAAEAISKGKPEFLPKGPAGPPPPGGPPPGVPEPGASLPNPGPALLQAVRGMEATVQAAKLKFLEKGIDIEKVIAYRGGRTATQLLIDMVESREIQPVDAARLFGVEYDAAEAVPELMTRLREASTRGGQILNRLSQFAKEFDVLLAKHPELKEELSKVLATIKMEGPGNNPARLYQMAGKVSNEIIQTWRAIIVTGWNTATRNFVTQGARVGAQFVDDVANGAFRWATGAEPAEAAFSNARETALRLFHAFSPQERAVMDKILEQFPKEKVLFGAYRMSDVLQGNKVVRLLNIFNNMQEMFFRHAAFDSRLRSGLKRLGVTIEDFQAAMFEKPGSTARVKAEKLVYDSVLHALEMTFASPIENELGRAILRVWAKAPILNVLGHAFPRYWMNAMDFNWQFSPLGLAYPRAYSPNPETAYRNYSRAMTGMAMLSAAIAIRHSKYAGKLWYEVRSSPDTDPFKVIDGRNFSPFATYLFMADALGRMLEMRSGERESLGYSGQEILNALVSIRRTDVSGIAFLDNTAFSKEDLTLNAKSFEKVLKKTLGDFIGGFATPVRNLRDVVAGLHAALPAKDTRESPLSGPTLEAFPGLRDILPNRAPLTRPGLDMREDVGMARITGIAAKHKTPAEVELDRLDIQKADFAPKTGDAETDRLSAFLMGPVIHLLVGNLSQSPEWAKMGREDRKQLLLEGLKEVRQEAVNAVYDSRVDLAAKAELRHLPARQRAKYEPLVQQAIEKAGLGKKGMTPP